MRLARMQREFRGLPRHGRSVATGPAAQCLSALLCRRRRRQSLAPLRPLTDWDSSHHSPRNSVISLPGRRWSSTSFRLPA